MYQVIRDDSILAISTNRSDGVSKAPYDSLNLAYHVLDNKDDVDTNYSLLANKLNIDVNDIYIPNQTHSKIMLEVKKNQTKITNECDALYTKDKGVYIGVLTADCLPILMYAHDKEVVVAIHAGWQGSDKLIVQECISNLVENENVDIQQLEIIFAPSIMAHNYEVQEDFKENILKHQIEDIDKCFLNKENSLFFDNRLFNTLQLEQLGISKKQITYIEECTYEGNYFSYRQDKITGRQLSLIGIK